MHRVLIALPQKGRDETKAVVDLALKTDAQVKVLPRASELIDRPLVQGLREINLEDLMGREHAPVDVMEIGEYLGGAAVLVSGAGGSIGSEIARQVARYGLRKLILLDRDDTLLCETAAELTEAELVLANITDRDRVNRAFDHHRPDVVFHAAAQACAHPRGPSGRGAGNEPARHVVARDTAAEYGVIDSCTSRPTRRSIPAR